MRCDDRVRVIRHDVNIGAAANFRSALEQAHGMLFMWLADDDWLEATTIAACAHRLMERPDHSLACASSRYVRDGEAAFVERAIDLLQSSARARVGLLPHGHAERPVLRADAAGTAPEPAAVRSDPRVAPHRRSGAHGEGRDGPGSRNQPLAGRSLAGRSQPRARLRVVATRSPELAPARGARRLSRHRTRPVFDGMPRTERRLLAAEAAALSGRRISWERSGSDTCSSGSGCSTAPERCSSAGAL